MTLDDVGEVRIELATEADRELPSYDYTKLSNISQCPKWGIIRYNLGLSMPNSGRAMALEAGKAAHEVYAAIRLLELRHADREDHFQYHGKRIYGVDRWEVMLGYLSGAESDRDKDLSFSLSALHTSDFYDDPRDRRRTISNIEEGCIAYFDRWPWGKHPVWLADEDDPTAPIGIEIMFDLRIEFSFDGRDPIQLRYTGRADGLHWHQRRTGDDRELYVHENKTASRLDDSWVQGMRMTHQVTGYTVAASIFTKTLVENAVVLGMAIPLPKTYDYGGIVREPMYRTSEQVQAWLEWILHTVQIVDQYKAEPHKAPMYTHSCNRYFRPCSFIPLCTSSLEEQEEIIRTELEYNPWNPLEEDHGAG